jgi:hypothetical protein
LALRTLKAYVPLVTSKKYFYFRKNQKLDQSPAIVETKNHEIEPIVEKPIS